MTTKRTYLGNELIIAEDQALSVIDLPHVTIHEGFMYTASYRWDALANGGTAWFTNIAGTPEFIHAEFEISVGGDCTFDIVEGGALTGGTAVTSYNRNRNAATPAIASILFHSGTVTGGTTIYQSFLPGGEHAFSVGGGARAESEWINLAGTTTAWKIVNVSGGQIRVAVEATFYDRAT